MAPEGLELRDPAGLDFRGVPVPGLAPGVVGTREAAGRFRSLVRTARPRGGVGAWRGAAGVRGVSSGCEFARTRTVGIMAGGAPGGRAGVGRARTRGGSPAAARAARRALGRVSGRCAVRRTPFGGARRCGGSGSSRPCRRRRFSQARARNGSGGWGDDGGETGTWSGCGAAPRALAGGRGRLHHRDRDRARG